jgi:serine/threonine protein kinase
MSSAASLSVSQMGEIYNVGRRIRFTASKPDAITKQLESMTFDVGIIEQIAIGIGRHSQVVIVRIIGAVSMGLDVPLVAKFYDPRFCQEVDFSEWPGGRLQRCAVMKTNESKAYRTLEPLQGSEIPNYLGEYTCCSPETAATAYDYPDAILLEFIDLPTLADIQPPDLSMTDRVTLKNRAYIVLSKIHHLGVYHHDIRPANVFWDRSNNIKVIDYGLATFKDGRTTETIEEWTLLDEGQLMSLLDDYGIEYEGPSAAPWFDESEW